MATFLMLSTLTPEGRETLHKTPERLDAVNQEIEQLGCKVLNQYALLGPYDFATLVDAPDQETVAHLAVDLGARRTINIMTLPAIPIDALKSKLAGSKHLAR